MTLRAIACLVLLIGGLSACASTPPPSGALSGYEGMKARPGMLRAGISERRDDPALAGVRTVALLPAQFTPNAETAWMNEAERRLLLREVDAQICFEVSERYGIANSPVPADASVRTVVARVRPTGRIGSALSAVGGFFIPGPIGVRVPAGLGGLTLEAELLAPDGRQLAALTWNRDATPVGTDNPSLSRIGDALQFVEPFADNAAVALSPSTSKARAVPNPDPCAQYGPRLRPEGWLAKAVTGLYVPQASRARQAGAAAAPAQQP